MREVVAHMHTYLANATELASLCHFPSLSSRCEARPWLRVGRAVRKGFLPSGFHAMNHDEGDDALALAALDAADWRRRVEGEAAGEICFERGDCGKQFLWGPNIFPKFNAVKTQNRIHI